MDIQTCFKQNLKRLRKAKGLSQEELAELVDVSSQHISDMETGRRWGSLETFKAIAKALGVEESALFLDDSLVLKRAQEALRKGISS